MFSLDEFRFEPDTWNHLILKGTWRLHPVNGKETSSHFFRIEVQIPTTLETMKDRVTSMSQALEQLARQIVLK
jgi:uncharacterized lipoprotein YmbA